MADIQAKPGTLENLHDCSVTLRHIAPIGTTLADVLRPDYWYNNVREVSQQRVHGRHAFNKIEVLSESGGWEAELRVMSVEGNMVETRLLRQWPEPGASKSRDDAAPAPKPRKEKV